MRPGCLPLCTQDMAECRENAKTKGKLCTRSWVEKVRIDGSVKCQITQSQRIELVDAKRAPLHT